MWILYEYLNMRIFYANNHITAAACVRSVCFSHIHIFMLRSSVSFGGSFTFFHRVLAPISGGVVVVSLALHFHMHAAHIESKHSFYSHFHSHASFWVILNKRLLFLYSLNFRTTVVIDCNAYISMKWCNDRTYTQNKPTTSGMNKIHFSSFHLY